MGLYDRFPICPDCGYRLVESTLSCECGWEAAVVTALPLYHHGVERRVAAQLRGILDVFGLGSVCLVGVENQYIQLAFVGSATVSQKARARQVLQILMRHWAPAGREEGGPFALLPSSNKPEDVVRVVEVPPHAIKPL